MNLFKKLLIVIIAILMILMMFACSKKPDPSPDNKQYETEQFEDGSIHSYGKEEFSVTGDKIQDVPAGEINIEIYKDGEKLTAYWVANKTYHIYYSDTGNLSYEKLLELAGVK